MAARGLYVYGAGYSYDWDAKGHRVRAQLLRVYAKRSLGLEDGPTSATLARNRSNRFEPREIWCEVPFNDRNKGEMCRNATQTGASCGSHLLKPEYIRDFCIANLGMKEHAPTIIEKIVEVEVQVEVPMVLSFEERDILVTALHREQHVTNEALRIAYHNDHIHDIRMLSGRIKAIVELMARFGIAADAWANGPAWLVDASFDTPDEQQPGEVLDPQTM